MPKTKLQVWCNVPSLKCFMVSETIVIFFKYNIPLQQLEAEANAIASWIRFSKSNANHSPSKSSKGDTFDRSQTTLVTFFSSSRVIFCFCFGMVNQISSSPTTKPQPQLTAAPHHTAAEDGTVRLPRSRRQGTWVYGTSVVGVKFYILGVQTWWMQWYIKPSTNKMSSNSSKETNVPWFTRGLPGGLARGVMTLKKTWVFSGGKDQFRQMIRIHQPVGFGRVRWKWKFTQVNVIQAANSHVEHTRSAFWCTKNAVSIYEHFRW